MANTTWFPRIVWGVWEKNKGKPGWSLVEVHENEPDRNKYKKRNVKIARVVK